MQSYLVGGKPAEEVVGSADDESIIVKANKAVKRNTEVDKISEQIEKTLGAFDHDEEDLKNENAQLPVPSFNQASSSEDESMFRSQEADIFNQAEYNQRSYNDQYQEEQPI